MKESTSFVIQLGCVFFIATMIIFMMGSYAGITSARNGYRKHLGQLLCVNQPVYENHLTYNGKIEGYVLCVSKQDSNLIERVEFK